MKAEKELVELVEKVKKLRSQKSIKRVNIDEALSHAQEELEVSLARLRYFGKDAKEVEQYLKEFYTAKAKRKKEIIEDIFQLGFLIEFKYDDMKVESDMYEKSKNKKTLFLNNQDTREYTEYKVNKIKDIKVV